MTQENRQTDAPEADTIPTGSYILPADAPPEMIEEHGAFTVPADAPAEELEHACFAGPGELEDVDLEGAVVWPAETLEKLDAWLYGVQQTIRKARKAADGEESRELKTAEKTVERRRLQIETIKEEL